MNARRDKQAITQSVRRCLDVLESIGVSEEPTGVSAVARAVGLSKATTHRLCQTLLDRQFLEQDPRTGQYRLGWRLLWLSSHLLGRVRLSQVVRPVLEKMAGICQQTAFAGAVTTGHRMLICEEVQVDNAVQPRSLLGRQFGLLDAPGGLLCLARLSRDRLRSVLKEVFRHDGHGADGRIEEIHASIEPLAGKAYSVQEGVPSCNLVVVCSSVVGRDDEVAGVIGYCCPILRFDPVDPAHLGETCFQASLEVSGRISR